MAPALTALISGHGRLSCRPRHGGTAVVAYRKRVSTRCSVERRLSVFNSRLVKSSADHEHKPCIVGAVEGNNVSKSLRDAGVGLLTALITFTANGQSSGTAFGIDRAFDLPQAGTEFGKPPSSALEAPSVSGDELDLTSSKLGTKILFSAPPTSSLNGFSRRETIPNEAAVLGVAEDALLPSQCTEEVAASLVPKEEVVEEVSNEDVVQEAWQVVNENFLDARHKSWSADTWLKKKQEVLKNPIRSRMAAYGAIRNMLSSLNDPYTRFLLPDQFSQLSKYDVTGIGLNIGEAPNASGEPILKVFGIVLGSPAQLAGVRQGDELLAVGGNSVTGKTAFEAASLIQGPKGTNVSIKIRHGQCGTPHVLEVERQQDVRSPVYYRLERVQDSKQLTGYIHLKEFNALAKRDLLTAMKRMQDAGAASYVLDLRDNPGGLVQAGIEIAKLFLDEGETVIETVGRDPQSFRSILAAHPPVTKAPLTILVNDHTASASEIVAAALHDNCRAVLVGKRTFGKGLIQAVYELSDGSGVVLTVGKYVTPGHQDIDGAGIEPDYSQPPGPKEAQEKLGSCQLSKAPSRSPKSPALATMKADIPLSLETH